MNGCCICATIKNGGSYLHKIFENIEKIGSLFEDYAIIFYYDKSEDDTLQKLKEYANKNHKFMFFVNQTHLSPYRTHNIANGRNYCLQFIKNKYSHWDFFIMMDVDDVCAGNVHVDILKHNLYKDTWDCLSFNKDIYYDIWALSMKPYIFSFWHFDNSLKIHDEMQHCITHKLNNIQKNELFICASAFNGFAIYRTRRFLNCSYDGSPRLDLIPRYLLKKNIEVCGSLKKKFLNEDCEHRSFHFEAIAKNNARIRISPEKLFT